MKTSTSGDDLVGYSCGKKANNGAWRIKFAISSNKWIVIELNAREENSRKLYYGSKKNL